MGGAIESALAVSRLADTVFNVLGPIGDVARAVTDNVFMAFKTAFGNIGVMAGNLFDGEIRGRILDNLWQAVKSTIGNVWQAVKNLSTNIQAVFGAMFEAVRTRSLDPFKNMVTTSITDGMKDVGKSLDNAILDLTKGTTTFSPIPITFSADPQKSAVTEFLEQSLAKAQEAARNALKLPGITGQPGAAGAEAGASSADGAGNTPAARRGAMSGSGAAVESRFMTGAGNEVSRLRREQLAEQKKTTEAAKSQERKLDNIFAFMQSNSVVIMPAGLRA